jgi:hypothetical protein
MKIFWSWQSDSPGKIGRHFVRDTLNEAIEILKQPNEIEEPTKQETREALHLDHDRKGVSGSPDLAPTIFRKIEQAAVFVADVTLIGTASAPVKKGQQQKIKKLINSNVAIEYGFALRALGDNAILMIQNRHFGEREELPFDLKHKAGPIQYLLAPGAAKAEIEAERARLKGELVNALHPYVSRAAQPDVPFEGIQSLANPSVFFDPPEVLARVGVKGVDEIEYRFSEPRAFYLRLTPMKARDPTLKFAELFEFVRSRRLDMLSRNVYVGALDRNRFGAIAYEPSGTSTTPRTFTQAFINGELWSVTTEFFQTYQDELIVPTTNVQNIYGRVLESFCATAASLGVMPPYTIEMGAVGLQGARLAMTIHDMSGPIHTNEIKIKRVLNDTNAGACKRLVDELLDALFDLAGEDRR